jgi:hypothetical protein
VAAERPLTDWLKPVSGKPGAFRSDGVGRDSDVDLVPFYRLHRRTYCVYWNLFTPAEWEKEAAEIAAERERQRKRDAATVSFAQPGETQPERDYTPQGEETSTVRVAGRPGRRAKKWFSLDLAVDPAHPMAMIVTYHSEERQARTFDILVDGERIGEQALERYPPGSSSGRFFDVEYAIPSNIVKDKRKVSVRFQAKGGNETAAVFAVRMVRADAKR